MNNDQALAVEELLQFLISDKREHNLSGAAGTGKTFLMKYICDQVLLDYQKFCKLMDISDINYWSVEFTATNNKAADVLYNSIGKPTSTVHSFLGLRVKENYTTGKQELITTNNYRVHNNVLLFIDEASMIDSHLHDLLINAMQGNCKIIYVGDHSQLPPVGEEKSPVYDGGNTTSVLTQPMRNNTQPALMDICAQFRETVATGIFKPITTVPNVIEWLDGAEMQAKVIETFKDDDVSARILCYTNDKVNEYNNFIRSIRNQGTMYTVGEKLIVNSAYTLPNNSVISAETGVTITSVNPDIVKVYTGVTDIDCYEIRVGFDLSHMSEINMLVPYHPEEVAQIYAKLIKQKAWVAFYNLKNKIPDLRPRDACTVHKSQGSTYDTVFIDLNNIGGKCWDANQVARMLYVAVSRARYKIYLRGYLPIKYGGAHINGS